MKQVDKVKKQNCQGCGICIRPNYIERYFYQVGDYHICSCCLRNLKRRGRLLVIPYKEHLFLHPDGKVSVEKVFGVGEEDD